MNHSKHPQIVANRATVNPTPQNQWSDEDRIMMRLSFSNKMRLKKNRSERSYYRGSPTQQSWHRRMFLGICQGIARFFKGKDYVTKKRRASNRQARKSKQINRR